MEKVLTIGDKNRITDFKGGVENTVKNSNDLINAFNGWQPFRTIKSETEFMDLVADPVEFFDQTLIDNLDLKANSGLKPSPAKISELYGIDRASWLNVISGRKVSENCIPCKKTKITEGRAVISLAAFQAFRDYVIFTDGKFFVDDLAIRSAVEAMQTVSYSPEQLATIEHFNKLIAVLSEHYKRGLIGPQALKQITGILRLRYTYPDFVMIDEDYLNSIILNTK